MGRPLNKKYFGNRNIGSASTTADDGIGGNAVSGATLTGANNSTGFTNNAVITVSAPETPRGVTATAKVVTYGVAGAITTATTFAKAGVPVAAAATYGTLTAPLASTATGGGTGATFIITKTGGGTSAYNSNTTITLVDAGSAYTTSSVVTIKGSLLGGVDTTNDLVITLGGAVSATGTIKEIVITEPGSGYVAVPTFTLPAGTIGTLVITPTLTAVTAPVGTVSVQENAIVAYAYIGGSLVAVDIIKQVQTDRYRVNSASTGSTLATSVHAKLKTTTATGSWPNGAGVELNIVAKDSAGGTYLVKKLTAHKAVIVPAAVSRLSSSAGTEFPLNADGSAPQIAWSFDAAVLNTSVQIENA